MKSPTLIVWLLVAACIAIDLAMIGELQVRRNAWPQAGGMVGLGLVFAQVALIALWTVWGRSKVVVRGVSTLLAIWAVSYFAAFSADGGARGAGMWFGVLSLYCAVSLVPFIITRFAGYEFASQDTLSGQDSAQALKANHQLSSRQFTIWGILSLMTATGIALAVLRFAMFPWDQFLEVAAFFALLAVTGCTILLLSLIPSSVIVAIIGTMMICPVAGLLLALTDLAPGDGPVELVLMTCVQGAATLSATIVLRTSGYRLRRTGLSEATASGSSGVSASGSVNPADEP